MHDMCATRLTAASVQTALGSTDPGELGSAIHAAVCFARHSAVFSASVIGVVSTIIEQLETPPPLRIAMAAILRHTLHDAATAQRTHAAHARLAELQPTTQCLTQVLAMQTAAATSTMLGVPEHAESLLARLGDVREPVQRQAVRGLAALASTTPALLPAHVVPALRQASLPLAPPIQAQCLAVIATLAQSPFFAHERRPLLAETDGVLASFADLRVAAQFGLLCTHCVIHERGVSNDEAKTYAEALLEQLLSLVACTTGAPTCSALSTALHAVVLLLRHFPHVSALAIAELLTCLHHAAKHEAAGPACGPLLQCLQRLAYQHTMHADHATALAALVLHFQQSGQLEHAQSVLRIALTAVHRPQQLDTSAIASLNAVIIQSTVQHDGSWRVYQLMRRACLLGAFPAAHVATQQLLSGAHARRTHHWLCALDRLAEAEAALCVAAADRILSALDAALALLTESQMHIDAAVGASELFTFQSRLLAARIGLCGT